MTHKEIYETAIMSVIHDSVIDAEEMMEVLDKLFEDRRIAVMVEGGKKDDAV